jgi:hypothetical protein
LQTAKWRIVPKQVDDSDEEGAVLKGQESEGRRQMKNYSNNRLQEEELPPAQVYLAGDLLTVDRATFMVLFGLPKD